MKKKESAADSLFFVIEEGYLRVIRLLLWTLTILCTPIWLPRWLWVNWKRNSEGLPRVEPFHPVRCKCRTVQDGCVEAMDEAYRRNEEKRTR